MKYPHLMSPLTIRGHEYRNRIVCGPTLFAHAVIFLPEIAENVYRMVEDRAKGGAAEVTTGELCTNGEEGSALFMKRPLDFDHFEGPDFTAIAEYATRIKRHGAVALLEFSHEGLYSMPHDGYQPWGPDTFIREDGVQVLGMDRTMREKVCRDFERFGRFAMATGFDGVLLHGGHGFILQQFVSQMTNHRTDEYGGSAENRARYPKELLAALRRGVGEDGIIELRFSAEDGLDKEGAMTIEDTVKFAELIDGEVDIFHVSNGLKAYGNSTGTFSSSFDPHGLNVEFARKIKAVMKKSYVAVIGGINSPEQGEDIIASGAADLVVLGREGFADPDFAQKIIDGNPEDIRRCLRCFRCYPGACEHPTDDPSQPPGSPAIMGFCTINPDSGFGRIPFDQKPPVKEKKSVLIVGGGAAGMQAAITAAQRGHEVTLVEANETLGGAMRAYAPIDPHKSDIAYFLEQLDRQTRAAATVACGVRANEDFMKNAPHDVLLLALGGKARKVDVFGLEYAADLVQAYQAQPEGKEILIAGAGMTACETAIYLAEKNNRVTLVLRGDKLAKECTGGFRNALMTAIERLGIRAVMGAQCLGFEEGKMVCRMKDGEEVRLEADLLYHAFGTVSMSEEAAKLQAAWGSHKPCHIIGDSLFVGRIGDAIHSGYEAAMSIGI